MDYIYQLAKICAFKHFFIIACPQSIITPHPRYNKNNAPKPKKTKKPSVSTTLVNTTEAPKAGSLPIFFISKGKKKPVTAAAKNKKPWPPPAPKLNRDDHIKTTQKPPPCRPRQHHLLHSALFHHESPAANSSD